ncbi:MBL fold metallo-hydrolase [Fodinicola feengrottensis]|uniref:MBL fold metallo-hydrolase n=1 Tax=Fodinicola feengrottensis TaxID=435914 RepID=A0ABN2GVQ6_9ACTN
MTLGEYVRPPIEVDGVHSRTEPVLGYLVDHRDGLLLFDTGIGAVDPETEAHYQPRRRPLGQALAAAGATKDDIALVVNCHLHFDHCGGNPALAGRPILVQRAELNTARTSGYTIPELVDFTGVTYTELDGEAELGDGVWLLPTPGRSPGHQSLVVRQADGTVVLAGQAHDSAASFGRQVGDGGGSPWLDRLLALDPARVLFAHDASVWTPSMRTPNPG